MAKSIGKVDMTGSVEFEAFLKKFGGSAADGLAKRALYEGMKVAADAVRRSQSSAIKGDRSTGDMAASLGVSHIRKAGAGYRVSLGYGGTDRRGRPNVVKARVLEKRTHYFSKALSQSKSQTTAAIKQAVEEALKNGGK